MADAPPFDPVALLEVLTRHGVRFVVVGGIAALSQGSPLPTEDVDVTPERNDENLDRLAAALGELDAGLRTEDGDVVPLPPDARLLAQAERWTLTTRHGDLDLVFAPPGTGGYDDLRRDAFEVDLGPDVRVRVASLADVIRSKEASNRPKDRAQLPALRLTLERVRARERS
ncbi:MAG: hypothetical protein IT201_13635 [Thermoleophilia bacterium]|nr:hypothetical protein [Thermoleophilia bacterium]